MTVKLSYRKAKERNSIVDYKEYMKKYDEKGTNYSLAKGSPKIINVEGTYVELIDLPFIISKPYMRFVVSRFVYTELSPKIKFIWERDSDGRVQ